MDVRKEYAVAGQRVVTALDRVSLDVREREFLTIVGPSGCGKTTLLKIVAGLIAPTGGAVELNGRRIDGPPIETVDVQAIEETAKLMVRHGLLKSAPDLKTIVIAP
jgi:ABC-type Fe3+/spermidine/putrescine transport system ATPase subunit